MDGTLEEQQEPVETYHVYPVKGGVVILKEEAEAQGLNTIETTLATQQTEKKIPPHTWPAFAFGIFYLFAVFSCIAFQVYCIFNPPSATINHSHHPNAYHHPCHPQPTGAPIDTPFFLPKTNDQYNRTRPPGSNPGKRISAIL